MSAAGFLLEDGTDVCGVVDDPEGADARRAGVVARLDFPAPVATPGAVREAFTALAETARRR